MAIELPYRRLAQVAEWSLLGLVVLLHAAGWLLASRLAECGPVGTVVADSVPLASLLLLAAWCALGPGLLWLRGAFALGFLLVVGVAIFSPERFTWSHNDALMGLAPLATLVCGGGLRLCGLRVTSWLSSAHRTGGATFTVRGLLLVTTAIALAVGGLESARPWLRAPTTEFGVELWIAGDRSLPQPQLTLPAPAFAPFGAVQSRLLESHRKGQFRLALAAALLTIAALLAYATILRPGVIWLRLAGLAMLIPAAGWYIGHLTDTDSESTVTLAIWMATITAIVAASLVPLRLMGYRLQRAKRPVACSTPTALAALPRFSCDRDHLVTNQAVRPAAEISS